ncbi:Endonuclease/exonuclease/phosphatase [Rhodofomes roseus]|uniref:Endonuclease/exonuclease/phosphatase n=1 Tax=Rhodofomes roseus TaxID=34475 RepID=A0ABQ8KIB2_9APHY|nr:Endonuclease/exonuclease/phosphatase [Rhodofomes roseus]KAH9837132.1 Endonuclease/exonuclease/phosphatase [Rhodofomes roseus]
MSSERSEVSQEAQTLALAEQRRLKKEQRQAALEKEAEERSRILPREWAVVQDAPGIGWHTRVMTWNLLAQTLVRRELFPKSDCLKAAQRENMIYREILSHNADICCMQGRHSSIEVDRLTKLLPVLEGAGYNHVYAAGPGKKHGCLIAFRKDTFDLAGERMIEYDLQEIRSGDEAAKRGSSFRTRNIASLVGLRRADSPSEGVLVATTHLFWHPSQAAILLREVSRFRDELSPAESPWPCIIAGDFNFPPDDAAYSLLTGDPLSPEQEARLAASRVVHKSIDPNVPVAPEAATEGAEEDEGAAATESDPDKVITNARPALPADGLLTDAELADMLRQYDRPTSVYDEGQRICTAASTLERELTFGNRAPIPAERHGAYEPNWTSYTHYWKSVLDYMFVLSPPQRKVIVTRLAKPHRTEAVSPGIPLKGVCGSDHISLGAELYLPSPS